MEMVSTAQRARLLVSLILLFSCTENQNVPTPKTTITYFPNSTDTMMVTQFLDGKEHGRWIKFYAPGQKMEERYFDKGRKVDTLRIWWENGVLQAEIPFKDDEYEGESVEWNKEGCMIRRMHYVKGHEEGAQQQWYDDGSVRSNYVIRNGRRYGLLGTKNCVNVSDSLDH